jgi:sugar phosphate isomerase/epimerase
MKQNRRNFLRNSGLAAASLGLGSSRLMALTADALEGAAPFGIQVYSVKEDMQADFRGTLKQLASYGYRQIESFEGADGMFWGMGNKGFAAFMKELGMDLTASHCDVTKDLERKAAEAAEIGMRYLICPWLGPQKSIYDFRRFADAFNKAGEVCRKNGLRFAYHNHDYSFKPLDGKIPQQVLMENTDSNLVDFEMDIYWVVTAGESPEAWLKQHPGRFRLCHIKDRMKEPLPDNKNSSCRIGKGVIPFSSILKTARANGMRYFFAEQEYYESGTALESAKANADHLRRLIRR